MEPFSAFLLLTAASLLVSAFNKPKTNRIQPGTFDTSSIPVAEEGTRIIEVFGDVNVSNFMVLWYGDYRTKKIKASKKSKK